MSLRIGPRLRLAGCFLRSKASLETELKRYRYLRVPAETIVPHSWLDNCVQLPAPVRHLKATVPP